jgi:ABC-type multidrug transport system ATPase subunit
MALVLEWEGNSLLLQDGQTAVIGRSKSADVPLDNKRISRQHLTISNDSGRWIAKDISSSNGTFLGGRKVTSVEISSDSILELGGEGGVAVTLTLVGAKGSQHINFDSRNNKERTGFFSTKDITLEQITSAISRRVSLGTRYKIGRDDSCDLTLSDLMVSKYHAEIVMLAGGSYEIVDLSSANGTFVNGIAAKRKHLEEGDIISIGRSQFVFAGSAIEPTQAITGLSLFVENLNFEVKGKKLLSNISLELKPSSVTAILGPSGSGKSTFLAAITGRLKGSSGQITLGGKDLIKHYEEIRNQIGFVPQADLLHTNLTVRDALSFGARLRFPKGTEKNEINNRIDEVLEELELTSRSDLRIDQLSGGQKKRASVAMELLTEPLLLFLDEPTSGLDPGLDRQVMSLLRKLADRGKTVVVVTHSTSNLDLADDLAVLAPGGKLAYFGSPKSVMQTFKTQDWAQLFEQLINSTDSGASNTVANSKFGWRGPAQLDSFNTKALQGWFSQFKVLSQRYLKVIASDKPLLVFMFLLPLIMAAVGQLAGSEFGLSQGPEESLYLNPSARSIILVLILGNAFIGASTSIQELVKERVIYAREHSVGLRASTYIASKLLVLGLIASAQSSLFTTLVLFGRDLPEVGSWLESPLTEIVISGSLLAVASMAIGLAVSAVISSRESAMPVLVVLTLVQVVMSGAVPLSLDWVLESLAKAVPAHWSLNMMAGTSNLNSLSFSNTSDYLEFWNADTWFSSMSFLLGMTVLASTISWLASLKVKIGRQ